MSTFSGETYAGKCKGGPHDGQMMAHWSRRKEFFSPVTPGFGLVHDGTPVIPVLIGEYYWAKHNYWQWKATDEGKALETLRKAAK